MVGDQANRHRKGRFGRGLITLVMATMLLAGCENPMSSAGLVLLSHKASNSGNQTKALALAKRAVAVGPTYDTAWSTLGIAYSFSGKYAKAADAFKKALKYNSEPSNRPGALFSLGTTEIIIGRYKDGIAHLEEVQSTSSNKGDLSQIDYYLGRAYLRKSPSDCDAAIKHFDKALKIDPAGTSGLTKSARSLRGECYLRQGRFVLAIADANASIPKYQGPSQKDDLAFNYRIKAFALLGAGDTSSVNDLIAQSERLNPDKKLARHNKILLALVRGDHEAVEKMRRVRPRIGVHISAAKDKNGAPIGALVAATTSGGPADKAGISVKDVIVRIGDTPVTTMQATITAIRGHQAGETIDVAVKRGDKKLVLKVTLEEWRENMDEYKSHGFIAHILVRNRIIARADAAASLGQHRDAFRIYMELSQKSYPGPDIVERIVQVRAKLIPPPKISRLARQHGIFAMKLFREAQNAVQFDRAAAEMRKAIKFAPWWSDAHLNLGLILEASDRSGEAVSSYRSFLAIEPSGPAAENARQKVFELISKMRIAAGS